MMTKPCDRNLVNLVVTATGVQDLLGLLEPLCSRDLFQRADWYRQHARLPEPRDGFGA